MTEPSPIYYTPNQLQFLVDRGVLLPDPQAVHITTDVELERISATVTLHPGTRISGARTTIAAQAQIGRRGAATVEDSVVCEGTVVGSLGPVTLCRTTVGPNSVLGSGIAEDCVFLGKETMVNDFSTGYGFRVRKGSLYEEDASAAQHTDTKMTILFPWVTLGSNINLCDLLISGGDGPELGHFTEVGSGSVHFNFTARGDKATGTLLGDAESGLFLGSERLFVGGNNSLIGPLQAEYGAFTPAGGRFSRRLLPGLNPSDPFHARPTAYLDNRPRNLRRIVGSQVEYCAQLTVLLHWYESVRIPFAATDTLRDVYAAGLEMVRCNLNERIRHLNAVLGRDESFAPEDRWLQQQWPILRDQFQQTERFASPIPEPFRLALEESRNRDPHLPYTQLIRSLPSEVVLAGQAWTAGIAAVVRNLLAC
ncbi:MAG TPA: hypothetical protein EYM25_05230 [Deltaproteobacteria bacterium]|nr:hypothetical protein [Deltaproteobacteria bacterium]